MDVLKTAFTVASKNLFFTQVKEIEILKHAFYQEK